MTSTTSGADKVLKLIQYGSSTWANLIRRRGEKRDGEFGLDDRLDAVSAMISTARTVHRFLDFPKMVAWLLSVKERDRVKYVLTILKISCLLAYYPYEHLYQLSVAGVLRSSAADINRYVIKSCRLYLAYLVLDFLRIAWDAHMLETQPKAGRSSTSSVAKMRRSLGFDTIDNICEAAIVANYVGDANPLTPLFASSMGLLGVILQLGRAWLSD